MEGRSVCVCVCFFFQECELFTSLKNGLLYAPPPLPEGYTVNIMDFLHRWVYYY